MSYRPRYDKGDHKAVCDVCGRLFKASSLKKRWDGLMTCSYDWEYRQPQDFVRGKADIQAPKWTRPEVSNSFVSVSANVAAVITSPYSPCGVGTIASTIYLSGVTSWSTGSGLPITYLWSITSAPVGSTATLSSTTAANVTITPDVEGAYTVQLIVDNGEGNTATTTYTYWIVPANQDFGTVVYAGPSESPLVVPASTTTITILGTTACGGQVRKTVTQTYTERVLLNQWKRTDTWQDIVTPALLISGLGYGATVTDARNASIANGLTNMAPVYSYGGTDYSVPVFIPASYALGYSVPSTLGTTNHIGTAETLVDLYYVDYHEVWTYDIV